MEIEMMCKFVTKSYITLQFRGMKGLSISINRFLTLSLSFFQSSSQFSCRQNQQFNYHLFISLFSRISLFSCSLLSLFIFINMEVESEHSRLNSGHRDELDHILSTRIGYGKAQDVLTMPLNVLLFTEGCQSVAIGLLLPQLQSEWHISTFQKSLLITVVYIGVSLGSYLQSFSDNIGRSVFIKWNGILQLIFGLLSCVSTSIDMFIVFRFFYGIGIGISFPLSATYMSECTPSENRAVILTKSRTYWSSGCLVTCILSWGFLYSHHWRSLLFLICLPGIWVLWQHIKNGKQSLRYLWANKRTEQVTQLLNYMAELNNRPKIPKQQIQYLIQQKQQEIQQGSFMELINQKYSKMTVILILAWFAVCFVYYGLLLLLPTILSKNTQTSYNFKYISLIVISLVEMLCFYFSRAVMDHPALGRKKSTYIGFAVVGVCSGILMLLTEDQTYLLLAMFFIMKIFITTTFMTLYPYSAEIYATLIRGRAMGVFSLSGRIGTALLGFIGVNALYWMDGNGLYFIFMCLCLSSAFSVTRMPYCTLGRPLDS